MLADRGVSRYLLYTIIFETNNIEEKIHRKLSVFSRLDWVINNSKTNVSPIPSVPRLSEKYAEHASRRYKNRKKSCIFGAIISLG
jgi:hypothetical protein